MASRLADLVVRPVTPANARAALDDFLAHRFVNFGRYQDAIWTNAPWLFQARLSQTMNVKPPPSSTTSA
jgi:deoxyribodipyrimidine photolyase-related protein